ncbi:MAG: histidine phosphatase family protein [Roseburia sp.]|nr:histidine phosphatase family protein [Roseburia sp.]
MRIYFIRHGQTKGNREKRYVGRTDEALLEEGKKQLFGRSSFRKAVFEPDILYVSPMRRCRETAQLLFPGKEQHVVDAFRECDFGEFEYRNYDELNGNPAYQRFLDSGGTCGFPGGETLKEFQERCVRGFCSVIASAWKQKPDMCVVFVVHGGTIMAILDCFSRPHKDYFEWQTENGNGYAAELSYDRENGEPVLESIVDLKEAL